MGHSRLVRKPEEVRNGFYSAGGRHDFPNDHATRS